uniref:(California timema) hypothetical protein n=1 Tax=Timema californicum TaxID=61474 RepID=A0A7R9JH89_TIMCA|nr:unnamed protein product [Timema californicum]
MVYGRPKHVASSLGCTQTLHKALEMKKSNFVNTDEAPLYKNPETCKEIV